MKHDNSSAIQPIRNDSTNEKQAWEKPKVTELHVKDTFGVWAGPNPDTDKRRLS